MSSINEALKQAAQSQEQIIRVPRPARYRTAFTTAIFLLIFACLAAGGFTIATERNDRLRADSEIASQMAALSEKYDHIMQFVENSDSNLDIRVQLDMMDLRSEYKALVARFDSKALEEQMTLKGEATALRKEIKSEIQLLGRRLHHVERDHSVLADRIEDLKQEPTGAVAAPDAQ